MAKQSNETNPGGGNPEGAPANPAAPPGTAPPLATQQIACDDSESPALYYNFARVSGTAEEVILDFGLNLQPFAQGPQTVRANHRIVMNQFTTKRLLAAISMTIQRHEQTFGVIELDVQRRANQAGGAR